LIAFDFFDFWEPREGPVAAVETEWPRLAGRVSAVLFLARLTLFLSRFCSLRTLLGVVFLLLASQTFKTLLLEELHAWFEVVLAEDWCELWWFFDVKSFGELD